MSTTSTNFSFVVATTSDTVNVVTQIANNFSSIDSILAISHTGTGQLKSGLTYTNPTLVSPVISGTATGGNFIGSTGKFNTITATGGPVTVDSLSIGTYAYPTSIGTTGALLTVVTGNAQWVAPSGGTGANTGLSNLASVAINTNLNTFTAGFVTMARVIATSGALTGLTSFQATAGTFAGNVLISGTATVNVVNCTGGSITAGGFTIGTYSYPATVGSTNQTLVVTTGNLVFASQLNSAGTQFIAAGSFSATSQVDITGLSIATNDVYKVFFTLISASNGWSPTILFNTSVTTNQYLTVASKLSLTTGTTGANTYVVANTTGTGFALNPAIGGPQALIQNVTYYGDLTINPTTAGVSFSGDIESDFTSSTLWVKHRSLYSVATTVSIISFLEIGGSQMSGHYRILKIKSTSG